jgi:hypothetical protein
MDDVWKGLEWWLSGDAVLWAFAGCGDLGDRDWHVGGFWFLAIDAPASPRLFVSINLARMGSDILLRTVH